MTISRRDTILIAVLINIGLMSILFMTAMHSDEDTIIIDSGKFKHQGNLENRVEPRIYDPSPSIPIAFSPEPLADEVDHVLNNYHARIQNQEVIPVKVEQNDPEVKTIEIVVKRGDALEKIARANATTVYEIKKMNNLKSDALSIGQKLLVPAPKKNSVEEKVTDSEDDEGVFYVIKSGDNPWKIARKFHVKYEEILLLNGLDEDNARNLKVGDTIRVK